MVGSLASSELLLLEAADFARMPRCGSCFMLPLPPSVRGRTTCMGARDQLVTPSGGERQDGLLCELKL